MSDLVLCVLLICLTVSLLVVYIRHTRVFIYRHRREMMDGGLKNIREAEGPNPDIVLSMVLFNPPKETIDE